MRQNSGVLKFSMSMPSSHFHQTFSRDWLHNIAYERISDLVNQKTLTGETREMTVWYYVGCDDVDFDIRYDPVNYYDDDRSSCSTCGFSSTIFSRVSMYAYSFPSKLVHSSFADVVRVVTQVNHLVVTWFVFVGVYHSTHTVSHVTSWRARATCWVILS